MTTWHAQYRSMEDGSVGQRGWETETHRVARPSPKSGAGTRARFSGETSCLVGPGLRGFLTGTVPGKPGHTIYPACMSMAQTVARVFTVPGAGVWESGACQTHPVHRETVPGPTHKMSGEVFATHSLGLVPLCTAQEASPHALVMGHWWWA